MSENPPLLFLHGAFGGPEVWTRLIAPWFEDRGYRVDVPALPGPVEGVPRLSHYIARARAAAESFDEPPIVIGHSLGGLIAQHVASVRATSGVVLVSSPGPAGLGPTLMHLAFGAPDVMAALMMTQAGAGGSLGVDAIRRVLFSQDTSDAWIAEYAPTPSPESPFALMDGVTWNLPAWPFARGVPMLALLGESDTFVPQSDLWTLALAYGAETEVLPGRGHGLPLDPEWKSVAERIERWIVTKPH